MFRPPVLTSSGWLRVSPAEAPLHLSVWIRHVGWNEGDFFQVKSLSGGIRRSVTGELRLMPDVIDEPWTLSVEQLRNVYNDYSLRDGDLLLVQLRDGDGRSEDYLFHSRQFGWITKISAGALVRTPVSFVEGVGGEVSPALALVFGFRYRFRNRMLLARWASRSFGGVISVGIGSTDLAIPGVDTLESDFRSTFNAMVAGGGVEILDFVSLQLLGNVSSFARDRSEANYMLAVGFDTQTFGRFIGDAWDRLTRDNVLREPE